MNDPKQLAEAAIVKGMAIGLFLAVIILLIALLLLCFLGIIGISNIPELLMTAYMYVIPVVLLLLALGGLFGWYFLCKSKFRRHAWWLIPLTTFMTFCLLLALGIAGWQVSKQVLERQIDAQQQQHTLHIQPIHFSPQQHRPG